MTGQARQGAPALLRRSPILITGGAGFIGSNLADRFAREGHDVLVFDSVSRPGVDRNLAWLRHCHPRKISVVVDDVRNEGAVADAAGNAQAVFHMAAQVAVTTSLVDPREDFDINVRGTLNLLDALRNRVEKVPLVFASTNKVYGDLADIPLIKTGEFYTPRGGVRDTGIGEGRSLDFHTPYGCSKGAADQYVLDYARSYGIPACVFRMSCIYGQRQMGTEDQGWVAHFLIKALNREPISIYGDGFQVRDVLDISDAVEAYALAWKHIERAKGRAFNLGGGPANAISLRQLLAHIELLLDRPVERTYSDWRAGDQRYYVSDTRLAVRELGWHAHTPWRDGVVALARWLQREGGIQRHPEQAESRPARPERCNESAPRLSKDLNRAWCDVPTPLSDMAGLRVLMSVDAVGGVWQYSVDLAKGLRDYSVEVTLAILGPAPSPDQVDAAHAAGANLVETGLPMDWTATDRQEVELAARTIAEQGARLEIDLIHLNAPALAVGRTYAIPVIGVCHSCVGTWWDAVRTGPLPMDFVWRTELVRQGYEACDVLLAPSLAFAETTARFYQLPTLPTVVRNGRRASPASRDEISGLFVFTAGRLWDEGKDLATIDRAAALVPLPVFAAGPVRGPNNTQIDLHHVIALGTLSEAAIVQRLSSKPIFVSAAVYEPFGLAVLEAAQAGCPLVLSDIPTFRELWDGAAFFVPPGDSVAVAAAIQHLANDPTARIDLGQRASSRSKILSVEAMRDAVLAAYGSLMRSHNAAKAGRVAAA